MTDTLNVYQRMNKACEIIGSQAWVRDLENKMYKSIPIDAMRNGVRAACVQAGLVHVGPVEIDYTVTRDDRMMRYVGTCKFLYVNVDNPQDFIEYESLGEAMDTGDKGIGKFVTNLIKNHYKAAFDIGEQNEDDVDSYSNEDFEQKKAQAPKATAPKADPFFSNTKKPATNERDKLIDELTDIYVDHGAEAEIIENMIKGFKKSSLKYCRLDELRQIKDAINHPSGGA